MISHIGIRPVIGQCRRLCTSPRMSFKFKLTDEMSKEFEKKQSAIKKPEPELAKHTKENSLIMGKVSHDRYKKIIKVGVPKHRLSDHLLLFVRENDDVQALDENDICKPGDWVLLWKEEKPVDEAVTHKVERVVHAYGNNVDPITNKRTLGLYYDEDMIRLEKIKVDL